MVIYENTLGLANGNKWVYKVGMFVDRLTEMRRGIGQGLENTRTGVNQFLHDERGSMRIGMRDLLVFTGGVGAGLLLSDRFTPSVMQSLIVGGIFLAVTIVPMYFMVSRTK